ncbi:zinc ABC transporter ATP-binding protein AztA [Streptomyces sp. DSM 44917]|uniref:Zinc ABC transporter ATP-binding protein AztA n=1 Tax=Streptomyces boetiae TaxID=3075541 RepID=A0ABU2LAN8_9ACTN|nr:zinc ABC transporter ATP-binding protein AztA [Streptomyces sp. DSM 44917]MDT0308619.1 zinc ABC transporter ATP-binding protein AztA [Streptomyces sp. DSM 44917]
MPPNAAEAPAEITVRDLRAGYGRHSPPALGGLTARVPRGALTALVGPNGSGKSTLLGVLAGVIRPASGTVERRPGAGRPAFVVQRSAASDALPLTVREAVAMGRWARRGPWRPLTRRDRAAVDACLERLGIRELAGRQLGAVSGGQRQRALVAQGLAQESGLLLLDEPAAGLDRPAQDRIRAVLAESTAAGTTVVQATHDLDEALAADHCLLLAGGRLLAEGPPAAVLTPAALDRAWAVPRPQRVTVNEVQAPSVETTSPSMRFGSEPG